MARLRSRGALVVTSWSSIRIRPSVTSSSPTIMRSAVDFPDPDGPTMIMNSPSLTSNESRLTATVSFGNRRVMFSSWMSAMALSLHGAGREARHDASLEDQDGDDDRHGDDHCRRGDLSRGLLELGFALEEGDCRGHGPRRVGRGQRDREQEIVPGEDEGEDGGREHPGSSERDKDAPECLVRRGAVDLRGLLELPRDLAEVRREE